MIRKANKSAFPGRKKRINWSFHALIFVGIAGGTVLILAVGLRPVSQRLGGTALVFGGALVGLISLWLDEVLRTGPERSRLEQQHEEERSEDRKKIDKLSEENQTLLDNNQKLFALAKASRDEERIRAEAEASSAYALARSAADLLTTSASSPKSLAPTVALCSDLGLRLTESERNLLRPASGVELDTMRISRMLRDLGRELPQRLWCFFELGDRTAWLLDQVETAKSTRAATDWLDTMQRNPFLPLAPCFQEAVAGLLKACRAFIEKIPENARQTLVQEVVTIVAKISSVYIQFRGTLIAYRRSPWFYTTDQGHGVLATTIDSPEDPEVRLLGVLDSNNYDVSTYENSEVQTIRVTRDSAGWHCWSHPEATTDDPCIEISLVVAVTDDGNPPDKAEIVVGVRRNPAEERTTASPDGAEQTT